CIITPMLRSPRAGRFCMALALAAAAWTIVTVLTGGFSAPIAGYRLSSRDPFRPLVIALALMVVARLVLGAAEFRRVAARVIGSNRAEVATRIAIAAAAVVLIVAIAWNTRAAGGSDSSCYAL